MPPLQYSNCNPDVSLVQYTWKPPQQQEVRALALQTNQQVQWQSKNIARPFPMYSIIRNTCIINNFPINKQHHLSKRWRNESNCRAIMNDLQNAVQRPMSFRCSLEIFDFYCSIFHGYFPIMAIILTLIITIFVLWFHSLVAAPSTPPLPVLFPCYG